MAATLKDIAKLVGVSVNTASRALKDKSDIGEQTRQRVKEAAAALGYRPNFNARGLVLKKTSTIGVAVTEVDNPVRMEFCEKLRHLAENEGYRLLTAGISIRGDAGDIDKLEDLLARGVDAMVIGNLSGLPGEQAIGKVLKDCHASNIPVTVFGTPDTGLADCVYIDFFESACQLTGYLLERGLFPIAFLGENRNSPRSQGYLKAMADKGLATEAALWHIEGHRLASGRAAMDAYLTQHHTPPQAIIAPNDLAAIGVISSLKSHGYSVPEDVSVVGFDNIELGEYYDPPLTTIGFNNGLFAQTVWELLSYRLKSGDTVTPARHIHLRQELIERKSCK